MSDVSLTSLWDGLLPPNLAQDFCAEYMTCDDPRAIPRRAGTLAQLWEASRLKSGLTSSSYDAGNTDRNWFDMADEYLGALPDNVDQVLRRRLTALRETLSRTIPDEERWSWERLEAEFPTLPDEKVTVILRFLEENDVETVHYVGYVDTSLCKALHGAGRFKLTIMDMLNKYDSGWGYHFDTDLNLTYFDRPSWLTGIAFYQEGAPKAADAWLRDCPWDRPQHLEEILKGRRRPMPYLILLDEAIEQGRHSYFEWEEVAGVQFGRLKAPHRARLSRRERTELLNSDRHMRGELRD